MHGIKSIFVFNTGSSSVKISLLCPSATCNSSPLRILTAHAQRIGTTESTVDVTFSSKLVSQIMNGYNNDGNQNELSKNHSSLQLSTRSASNVLKSNHKERDYKTGERKVDTIEVKKPNMTHEDAIRTIVDIINKYSNNILSTVSCVGHRVVHGGDFSDATIVNDDILERIQSVSHLAPLHNPANLLGIKIGKELFKDVPQISIFDTAFHTTIPDFAYTYPIPREYIENKIRKYGFHGTSVKYVSKIALKKLDSFHQRMGKKNFRSSSKLVVAHLGNGASVTAVVDGKSVDTTMEFTPLSGVMMGTRSGSIDPSIITFASSHLHKTPDEVVHDLNKRSGLKAVGQGDGDMRSIEMRVTKGDKDAQLALDMFVYILSKHIAAMIVACGGSIDALIFTAGIGEHSALVRKEVVSRLGSILNATIDDETNLQNGRDSDGLISSGNDKGLDKAIILVIPTDEEIGIFEECEVIMAKHF